MAWRAGHCCYSISIQLRSTTSNGAHIYTLLLITNIRVSWDEMPHHFFFLFGFLFFKTLLTPFWKIMRECKLDDTTFSIVQRLFCQHLSSSFCAFLFSEKWKSFSPFSFYILIFIRKLFHARNSGKSLTRKYTLCGSFN